MNSFELLEMILLDFQIVFSRLVIFVHEGGSPNFIAWSRSWLVRNLKKQKILKQSANAHKQIEKNGINVYIQFHIKH